MSVPAQDLPENQDPSVNYTIDRFGRRLDADGKVIKDAGDVGFGSGSPTSISDEAEVRAAQERVAAEQETTEQKDAETEPAPKRATRKAATPES